MWSQVRTAFLIWKAVGEILFQVVNLVGKKKVWINIWPQILLCHSKLQVIDQQEINLREANLRFQIPLRVKLRIREQIIRGLQEPDKLAFLKTL